MSISIVEFSLTETLHTQVNTEAWTPAGSSSGSRPYFILQNCAIILATIFKLSIAHPQSTTLPGKTFFARPIIFF